MPENRTYVFTDLDGDRLTVRPTTTIDGDGVPVVSITAEEAGTPAAVFVPLDRVEEIVDALRDAARLAATPAP